MNDETYYEGLCRLLRGMVGKTTVSTQHLTIESDWTLGTTIDNAPAWLRGYVWMLPRHAADAIERLIAERDEARRRTNYILTEIDFRIECGAESNGHLEAIRSRFKENTDE